MTFWVICEISCITPRNCSLVGKTLTFFAFLSCLEMIFGLPANHFQATEKCKKGESTCKEIISLQLSGLESEEREVFGKFLTVQTLLSDRKVSR